MPVIQLGPLALPVFPLAVILGGWLGLEISTRAARRLGLDGDHIYNAFLYALAAGIIAGRLAHVVAFWPAYQTQPIEIIGLNTRAFLIWPGVIAAAAVWAWYVRRHRLPWASMLDAFAPGVLSALAVASIGAFVAGRNPGAPADLPWAVTQWGAARHPVQLYEAAAYGITAWAVWRCLGRGIPGTAAWTALLGYGITRWAFEPFRAESAVTLEGIRVAQVLGLAAALLALWMLHHASPPASQPTPEAMPD